MNQRTDRPRGRLALGDDLNHSPEGNALKTIEAMLEIPGAA